MPNRLAKRLLFSDLAIVEMSIIESLSAYTGGDVFSTLALGDFDETLASISPGNTEEARERVASYKDTLHSECIKQSGVYPLDALCESIGLDDSGRFIVLLLLGYLLLAGWQKYAAVLQNGNGLALSNYFVSTVCERRYRDPYVTTGALQTHSSLIRYGIIRSINGKDPLSKSAMFEMDAGVAEFLMGIRSDSLGGRVSYDSSHAIEKEELRGIVDFFREDSSHRDGFIVHLYGPSGTPLIESGAFIGKAVGRPAATISLKDIMLSKEYRIGVLREVRLKGASVVLDTSGIDMTAVLRLADHSIFDGSSFSGYQPDPGDLFDLPRFLSDLAMESPGVVILAGGDSPLSISLPGGTGVVPMGIDFPSKDDRIELWRSAMNGHGLPDGDDFLQNVISRYKLTEGQIERVSRDVRAKAMIRDGAEGRIHPEDILEGVVSRYGAGRSNGAGIITRVPLRFEWNDLILPPEQMRQLEEIRNHLKNRDLVWDTWGYGERSGSNGGIHVLFSGKSGTGKTMAAGVIAKELGLELLRVDLSMVVSKYIGETEKNLSRVFNEARSAQAILFFDEADALFGKRSEVKDARDRYANIEVGYLLQKMEEFDGMTVLASNMRTSLDDAFTRRIHHIVEFPMPEGEEAMRIWKGVFPPEVPLEESVDFEFLSKMKKLSGGNIKNISLNAALYTAEEGSDRVGMVHIVQAIRREFMKIGWPYSKSEMEPYYLMGLPPWAKVDRY